MTRPLFNPDNASGGEPPKPATPPSPLTVAQVSSLITGALEKGLPQRIRVVGEVSGLSDRTHWYFRLKDESAVLDCVMFASSARRAGFRPTDGMKVILSGRIEYYAKQGRTQFYAETMQPLGEGDLEQRFRALCAELRALGWFEPERKRPIPAFPGRIGVVTSRTGAALQDVLVTMRRRCPAVEVVMLDVRVQGEGAAEEVARAVRRLSEEHEALGIEAILVTRGGGSIEDLWAFNERIVAEAIVASRIPVVAAIGHETDTTIAELVSDHRAATPTQAAMALTPDREALGEELEQKSRRLRSLIARGIERSAQRLRGLLRLPVFFDPRTLAAPASRRLVECERRLAQAPRARLAREQVRLERLSGRLAHARPAAVIAARREAARSLAARLHRAAGLLLSRCTSRIDALERELIIAGPGSVLNRGYSVTMDEMGRVIRQAHDAPAGAVVITRVADGSFRSRVEGGEANNQPPIPRLQPPPRKRPPRQPRGAGNDSGPDSRSDQMRLF